MLEKTLRIEEDKRIQSEGAMKVVYFITSHGRAPELTRLCNVLVNGSSDASIVIHHDPGVGRFQFSPLPSRGDIHVLENPVAVKWGDFSFVRAAMVGIDWILRNRSFDWLIWISGQDYPVKPIAQIEEELGSSAFDGYVYAFPHDDPDHWPPGQGFTRYYFQYLNIPRIPFWHRVPLSLQTALSEMRKYMNRVQPLVRVRGQYRNHPSQLGFRSLRPPFSRDFCCWGGYNWLNLSRPCVEYLRRFHDEHPDLVRYYSRTPLPEESFFQSILFNARMFRLAPNSKRWINWSRGRKHATSPDAITAPQVRELLKSDAWFARKFDFSASAEALDLLDKEAGR